IHRLGARKHPANIGTVTSQAIAGSLAYQARPLPPRRSANQPPAKTPAQPPISICEARKLAVDSRSRRKLRINTDGVQSARPYPHSELAEAPNASSQNAGLRARIGNTLASGAVAATDVRRGTSRTTKRRMGARMTPAAPMTMNAARQLMACARYAPIIIP